MSKVRIENHGHVVEIDADKPGVKALTEMAWRLWVSTRPAPGLTTGFGSQYIERTPDRPVLGNGAYEIKPDPVTS